MATRDYVKLNCVIQPHCEDFSDVLAAELGTLGFESFEHTAEGLAAYIPFSQWDAPLKGQVKNLQFDFFRFDSQEEVVEGKNWNEEWEKNYFQPLLIGDCVVRASFHEAVPGIAHDIVINPKMAFGTGNHATTSLMLSAIQGLKLNETRVLDMGCGTGVLAILASMRGAKEVVAIDYDIWSYESCLDNTAINDIKNVKVFHGDASALKGLAPFDIIFANIQRNVLLEDMSAYTQVLNNQGHLLMSGFYEADLPAIRDCAEKLGYCMHEAKVLDKWTMAHFILT